PCRRKREPLVVEALREVLDERGDPLDSRAAGPWPGRALELDRGLGEQALEQVDADGAAPRRHRQPAQPRLGRRDRGMRMAALCPALETDDLAGSAERGDALAAARVRLAELDASGSDDEYAVESFALPEERLTRLEHHSASDQDAGARARRIAPAASCMRAVGAIEIAPHDGGARPSGIRHRSDASARSSTRGIAAFRIVLRDVRTRACRSG